MKIAVIGGGSMGRAFVRTWLEKEVELAENLLVIENSSARRKELESHLSVRVESDYGLIKEAGLIFIAVKPQDFPAVSRELSPILKPEQLVVSIMAGVPINSISLALGGHSKIVRVMPNLPILIGAGISAYYADPSMEHVAINILDQLLKAGGETLRLPREDLLNAVTALSGSGPGYLYYFLKHLMAISKEFGFTEDQAKVLIGQTLLGATKVWLNEPFSAEELCEQVTSRGGTTGAALNHFDQKNLAEILKEGLRQAKKRAAELASGNS